MSQKSIERSARPLSPHLQVYKPQLTSMTSVLHRITGAGLSVGLAFFTWWLVAAATGPEAYGVFTGFFHSGVGIALLLGWTMAFYYHLANGIRHLIWDTGLLFKIKNAYAAGYFVLFLTVFLTAMTWLCVCTYQGWL